MFCFVVVATIVCGATHTENVWQLYVDCTSQWCLSDHIGFRVSTKLLCTLLTTCRNLSVFCFDGSPRVAAHTRSSHQGLCDVCVNGLLILAGNHVLISLLFAWLPNVLSKYSVARRVYLSDQARTQLRAA